MVVGSTLAFLENGTERIAVYDPALTGGAPGILISGTAKAGDWSGGTAGFAADYLSTDANGVESYDMISADDGYGPQILRVLPPPIPRRESRTISSSSFPSNPAWAQVTEMVSLRSRRPTLRINTT